MREVPGQGKPVTAAWPTMAEMELDDLQARWGAVYLLSYDHGMFCADRTDGTNQLIAGTIAALESALRADWARWCDLGTEGLR